MKETLLLSLTIIFDIISSLALATNATLILVCSSIKDKKRDIKLAIILAVVDLLLPSIILTFRIIEIFNSAKGDLRKYSIACSIVGPINFICLVTSTFLVSLIACYRWGSVTNNPINYKLIGVLSFLYGSFCLMVIIGAINNSFQLLPNEINCSPLVMKSKFSAFIVLMFGVNLLIFISIAIGCYYHILTLVSETVSLTNPLHIRISISTFVYSLLMVPSCILVIGEGLYAVPQSLEVNIFISVSLATTSLANPLLVLFAHAIIYRQLSQRWSTPLEKPLYQNYSLDYTHHELSNI